MRAEAQVRGLLEAACAGEVELQKLELIDASSRAGTPHTAYRAAAECKT